MESDESFLTEKQKEILRLKVKGLSQAEIARKLETSRANINSILKRADENIEKSKNTLKIYRKIKSPVKVKIRVNDDIINGIEKLLSKADEEKIHVSSDIPELVSKIKRESNDRLQGRRAIKEIHLLLDEKGKVHVN